MHTEECLKINYQVLADLSGSNLLTGTSFFAVKANNVSKLIAVHNASRTLLDLSPSVTQVLEIPATRFEVPGDHSKLTGNEGFTPTVTISEAYVDVRVPLYTVKIKKKASEQPSFQLQLHELEGLLRKLRQQADLQENSE